MNLTPAQRQDLARWAEWRDLQLAYHNLSAYLHFTTLADLDVGKATLLLDEIGTRRAEFLARWQAHQGGTYGHEHGNENGGRGAGGNAAASGGDAGEAAHPCWDDPCGGGPDAAGG